MRKLHYLLIISLVITLLSFIIVSISSGNIFQANENKNTAIKNSQTDTSASTEKKVSTEIKGPTENKPENVNDDKSKAATPTEGQPPDTLPPVKNEETNVIFSLPIKERAVFITIDDGWNPCWPLVELMQKEHIPITSFLIEQAAKLHPDFWGAFVAAGGDIENHTLSHENLKHLGLEEVAYQISQTRDYLKSIGVHSTLLRPPFGSYNEAVRLVAQEQGIKNMVLWNAVMDKGKFTACDGRPLKPGTIILLHWTPDLYDELTDLLTIIKEDNLGVADLASAIKNPDNVKVTWLN